MKFSESMILLQSLAEGFRDAYRPDLASGPMKVEFYFMALFDLPNVDIRGQPWSDAEKNIASLDLYYVKRHLEVVRPRKDILEQLRARVQKASPDQFTDSEPYRKTAELRAMRKGATALAASRFAKIMLMNPTPLVQGLFQPLAPDEDGIVGNNPAAVGIGGSPAGHPLVKNPGVVSPKSRPAPAGKTPEGDGPNSLAALMDNVRVMTDNLRQSVFGQDHAVQAFVEGYFNAEVVSQADTNRKRPKAVFLFAGPPGVGKTLLAEKAAELLRLPFRRFDMSSYSDHETGVMALTGIEKSYKSARPGFLTGFVRENPKCVLLFDEIEKAHMNVIHLFLQLLDAGEIYDHYEDETLYVRDAIIILTTNAGHNLYEGREGANLAGLSKQVILKGLETDINPQTGNPLFPTAICSRLASGTVVMFNHLQVQDLQSICRTELNKNNELFHSQYGISLEYSDKLPSLLLYRGGCVMDARSLRGQTELFVRQEIMRCLQLYNSKNLADLENNVSRIRFEVEDWPSLEALFPKFQTEKRPQLLIFGGATQKDLLTKALPDMELFLTDSEDEAFSILGKEDIDLILVNPVRPASDSPTDTIHNFDLAQINATALRPVRDFVSHMRERLPDEPVYVLDRMDMPIDSQLEMSLIQLGIRGKIDVRSGPAAYSKAISLYLEQAREQRLASEMSISRNRVEFETSPMRREDQKEIIIRCRNFSLEKVVSAEDADDLVGDAQRPTERFPDVVGAKDAKEELNSFIRYLKNPKKYLSSGAKPPKGVLLYGPPGTGKTMLAKAMAGECGISFLSETASNFVGQYTGTGPAAVRRLFEKARKYAPAIIFIDEIDAIGRTRTGGVSAHAEETTLNTLLSEMDGFKVDLKRPVFILAATNFKVEAGHSGAGYIDPALVRRFDRSILVDLPDRDERLQLLQMLTAKLNNCQVTPKMLEHLAGRSVGMSPALITNFVDQGRRLADRSGSALTDKVLEDAFETAVHGEAKDWGYESMERVAWHESGHAYLYWKAGNTPSYVTIVARGDHGGYMQHDDKEAETPIKTRAKFLESIRVSLGGRAAEMVKYGPEDGISSGPSGDLEHATRTAQAMLCSYGMDDELGLMYITPEMASSSEMALLLHKKIAKLLKEQLDEAVAAITADRPRVERLVAKLLEKNSLTGDEIKAVLEADS